VFSTTGHDRDSELLKYVPENRSSPRVVTGKWLSENYKLTTRTKNKSRTNPKIKNHKRAMNSDCSDHIHDTNIQNTFVSFINTINTVCGKNCEISCIEVSL
jgi:hypothetical protein